MVKKATYTGLVLYTADKSSSTFSLYPRIFAILYDFAKSWVALPDYDPPSKTTLENGYSAAIPYGVIAELTFEGYMTMTAG